MGALETVKKAISNFLSLEEDQTVLVEATCDDCGATSMVEEGLHDATCDECGSDNLEEEGRMYVGGGGIEGA